MFSSDEVLAGVRYRAVADWSVLGRKLRKDLGKVKNALPGVSSDAVKAYIESGELEVEGIQLAAGDLTVQRYLELPLESQGRYGTHTDNDVVIRLDIQVHPELQGEWYARELTNRVQKLRKKAGLQATDDVNVFYGLEGPALGADLVAAMEQFTELIQKTIGCIPSDIGTKQGGTVLIAEPQEVGDIKFTLTLVKP